MRLVLFILAALPALPCLAGPWDDFRCPSGLILKSNTTRDGRHERWCETTGGKREGPFRAWYENGEKWQTKEFRDGRQHGMSTLFLSNGVPSIRGEFDMGKKVGIWRRWWGNRQLKSAGRWAGYKPCGKFKCFTKKGDPAPCPDNHLIIHAGCRPTETGATCPTECRFNNLPD